MTLICKLLRAGALGLGFGLFGLTSCGGGETPGLATQGVLHLDPRLEDGRGSAEAIEAASAIAFQAVITGAKQAAQDLKPWSIEGKSNIKTEKGICFGGSRARDVRLSVPTADAEDFNAIELTGSFDMRTKSSFAWTDKRGKTHEVHGVLSETSLRFDLGKHTSWSGRVTDLVIRPVKNNGVKFRIDELRLVHQGFDRKTPSEAGDGGLFLEDGGGMRVWPTDEGGYLFDSAQLPRGARVSTKVRITDGSTATFTIEGRKVGTEEWENVASDRVTTAGWHELDGDLSYWGGEEVELRFRAGEETEARSPTSARFLWGAPVVYGELHEDRRPNVLLFTLDTLRADALGCYGGPPVTPTLDALAARGTRFASPWSACNSTLPSHVSILVGRSVPAHGVDGNRARLAEDVPTLAELYRGEGYRTGAVTSVSHLAADYSGLSRGFDFYECTSAHGGRTDGALAIAHAKEWLDDWHGEEEQPFFLWVHLFDPHAPYTPPPGYLEQYEDEVRDRGETVPPKTVQPRTLPEFEYTRRGQFLEGVTNIDYVRHLYRACVQYTDDQVAVLLQSLEGHGVLDDTIIAVTADHGENLGEHTLLFNHHAIFPQTVNVPLIVAGPGVPTRLEKGVVSTQDLAPTLASLTGFEFASGVNLVRDGDPDGRAYFVHSGIFQVGFRQADTHYALALRDLDTEDVGKLKQVNGDAWLYQAKKDPNYAENRASLDAEAEEIFRSQAQTWLKDSSTGKRIEVKTTAEQEAELNALGYGGGDDEDED